MSKLYTIKPLEWDNDARYACGRFAQESGPYYVEPHEDGWMWSYEEGPGSFVHGEVISETEAKEACQQHFTDRAGTPFTFTPEQVETLETARNDTQGYQRLFREGTSTYKQMTNLIEILDSLLQLGKEEA